MNAGSVGVAMATWNGARHLGAQLDSIARQSVPVSLHVVDDASTDATPALLRAHPIGPDLHVATANRGFVATFEAALTRALAAGHEWIALSDQDDVWDDDRIAEAWPSAGRARRSAARTHRSSCTRTCV